MSLPTLPPTPMAPAAGIETQVEIPTSELSSHGELRSSRDLCYSSKLRCPTPAVKKSGSGARTVPPSGQDVHAAWPLVAQLRLLRRTEKPSLSYTSSKQPTGSSSPIESTRLSLGAKLIQGSSKVNALSRLVGLKLRQMRELLEEFQTRKSMEPSSENI